MTRYGNDPRWIKARYNSKCPSCTFPIDKGDDILWVPVQRIALCGGSCGRKAWAEFVAGAEDEAALAR